MEADPFGVQEETKHIPFNADAAAEISEKMKVLGFAGILAVIFIGFLVSDIINGLCVITRLTSHVWVW